MQLEIILFNSIIFHLSGPGKFFELLPTKKECLETDCVYLIYYSNDGIYTDIYTDKNMQENQKLVHIIIINVSA